MNRVLLSLGLYKLVLYIDCHTRGTIKLTIGNGVYQYIIGNGIGCFFGQLVAKYNNTLGLKRVVYGIGIQVLLFFYGRVGIIYHYKLLAVVGPGKLIHLRLIRVYFIVELYHREGPF